MKPPAPVTTTETPLQAEGSNAEEESLANAATLHNARSQSNS